jgi:ABC-type phosphate/phosphonate transport system substrate-binding protein
VTGLRLLSYLSPSIPEGLFELLADAVGRATGVPVGLAFETRVSGPTPDDDPFASGRADVAFVCSPSYPLLKRAGSPVCVVPAAAVFEDPRAQGRPVYFSDVILRPGLAASRFEELEGGAWAYNDRQSKSGWGAMVARLANFAPPRVPGTFFGWLVPSGSHRASVAMVAAGAADAAAIDSNVLWLARRDGAMPGGLRVLESWGPMPIQPVLARASLPPEVRRRIAEALLELSATEDGARRLAAYGVRRFAAVDPGAYDTAIDPVVAVPPAASNRS